MGSYSIEIRVGVGAGRDHTKYTRIYIVEGSQ